MLNLLFFPPHAADQGKIDDTQISDHLKAQLGVFSAATSLADAARRRQSVENVQTYTRRRREVSTALWAKQEKRIDFETALELQKQLDEREEVAAKVDQAHDIDWSDPAVLRYHTLQNRHFFVVEAFIPMGSEIEKEVMKRSRFDLQQESSKPVEEEIV
ncbi:hypothetical protein Tco_0507456 [Tanacetum coccineum]